MRLTFTSRLRRTELASDQASAASSSSFHGSGGRPLFGTCQSAQTSGRFLAAYEGTRVARCSCSSKDRRSTGADRRSGVGGPHG
jgi:hypothetical protein